MLYYDFDILRLPPLSHYGGGRIEAHFRDRSTSLAFREAPAVVREWLLNAGFRDRVSGSTLLPGCYDAQEEVLRVAILSKLEKNTPKVQGGSFDVRSFVTQSLRAKPQIVQQGTQTDIGLAPLWGNRQAASG